MRGSEVLRHSWKCLRQKTTLILMAVIVLAFQWLFSGADRFLGLYTEMAQPVELRCEFSLQARENLEELQNISGVRHMFRYEESVQQLSFGGYQAEVTLIGAPVDYLEALYGDVTAVPLSGSMPYIVLDQSVLSAMANDKKEKLKVSSLEDFLLKTFKIGDSGPPVRIAGVFHEENNGTAENDGKTRYVYTTLEGYEKIMGAMDQVADVTEPVSESLVDGGYTEAAHKYFIQLENGFFLEEMLTLFGRNGITLLQQNVSMTELTRQWQEGMDDGRQRLMLSLVAFVCFGLMFYFQGALWRSEHGAFVDWVLLYDGRGRFIKRMGRYCLLLYLFVGGAGGGALYYVLRLK